MVQFIHSKACQWCSNVIFWNEKGRYYTAAATGEGTRHYCTNRNKVTLSDIYDELKEIKILVSKLHSP